MDPTRVSLRRLHSFRVLAETLHFGRAAELLDVTQPGLSQEILKLEAEVGVRLFTRTPRVSLTDAGQLLLEASFDLMNASALFTRTVESLPVDAKRKLFLAVTPSILHRNLEQMIEVLQTADSLLEIHIHELNTVSSMQAVQDRHADIAIAHGSADDVAPALTTKLISKEDLCLAAPRNWEGNVRSFLQERPFIIFRREVSPQFHDRIVRALDAIGVKPRIHHQTSSWASTVHMVRQGFGVAAVPQIYSRVHAKTADLQFFDMPTPVASDIWAAIRTEDLDTYKGHVFKQLPQLLA